MYAFRCRLNGQLRDRLGVGDIFGFTLLVGNEQRYYITTALEETLLYMQALVTTPSPDRAADVTIFAVITKESSQVGYLTEEGYFFSADYTFGFAGFS